eukprot:6489166-Amphidinium_carterae.1
MLLYAARFRTDKGKEALRGFARADDAVEWLEEAAKRASAAEEDEIVWAQHVVMSLKMEANCPELFLTMRRTAYLLVRPAHAPASVQTSAAIFPGRCSEGPPKFRSKIGKKYLGFGSIGACLAES